MATSYNYFKDDIRKYIEINFKPGDSILDVGAGSGTYKNLLPNYKMDAVEVHLPNIEKYNLRDKYTTVVNADIRDFEYAYYDLIIFGDVIEHLTVEEAQKVLKYAFNKCKEMIVAVPYNYKQGIVEDNEYEIHKQDDLTHELFLERYPFMKLLYKNEYYGYYIKGEEQ